MIDCFFLTKISDWSDEMSDIFKDIQANVGCEYISDLPSYKRKVWQEMKRLNPADYEERQLEDFSKPEKLLFSSFRMCAKFVMRTGTS